MLALAARHRDSLQGTLQKPWAGLWSRGDRETEQGRELAGPCPARLGRRCGSVW